MFLSLQLPITIFLQLYMTSSRRVMGSYTNRRFTGIIPLGHWYYRNIDEYLLISYRLIYTACFVKAFTEIGGILFCLEPRTK